MGRSDYKMKAFHAYCEYAAGNETSMPEDRWVAIWSVIKHYVTAVIKGKDYNCSEFDLDDHLAELQLELWSRLSQRKIPCDSPSLFVGSVRVVTQQFLIGNHRKTQAEERSRDKYAESTEPGQEPNLHGKLWAAHLAGWHKDVIAEKMAGRARFDVVDFDLCRNYVELECRNADSRTIEEMIIETGYWDPGFMYTYLTILYRWVYYDVTYGPEALVA